MENFIFCAVLLQNLNWKLHVEVEQFTANQSFLSIFGSEAQKWDQKIFLRIFCHFFYPSYISEVF